MSENKRKLEELCVMLNSLRVDAETASGDAHKHNPRMISLIFSGLEKRLESVQTLALRIRDKEASHE